MNETVAIIAYGFGLMKEKVTPSTEPDQIAGSVLAMGGSVLPTDNLPDSVKALWQDYCAGKVEDMK